MKLSDNEKKQRSLEVAEDARQTRWEKASFVADLFKGEFNWSMLHPFPLQSEEDKAEGDAFLDKLEHIIKMHIDPDKVDQTGIIPPSAIHALAEIGCFGIKIPKRYGGLGLSQTNYNRAIALVASWCSSTAVLLSAHQSIGVSEPLKHFGTPEQKEQYLPRLAHGAISAFALTEEGVGSDPANLATTAELSHDGKHYILSGRKMWCTNGPIADILIVMARTPSIVVNGKEKKQITAFIVERNLPGVEVLYRCDFMGLKGIQNGILRFDKVKVPVDQIIGKTGDGLRIALKTLNTGRLTLPAASAAAAKVLLSGCRSWIREREQWGSIIGKHQFIEEKMSKMASYTYACEAITWLTSSLADIGKQDIRLEAAMAKYFCTEICSEIADDALQVRGGRGYETVKSLKERGENPLPVERILRDIRINRIIEGTSEIMKLFIAREAMDTHLRFIFPIMNPRTPLKDKLHNVSKAILFYTHWYPTTWVPSTPKMNTKYLSAMNRKHLKRLPALSRKLARTLFHTMGRHQHKLEREQMLIGGLVDIGTWLFACSSVLAYTEALALRGNSPHCQELANHFCQLAFEKIDLCFNEFGKRPVHSMHVVTDSILHNHYDWLENGIISTTEQTETRYPNLAKINVMDEKSTHIKF